MTFLTHLRVCLHRFYWKTSVFTCEEPCQDSFHVKPTNLACQQLRKFVTCLFHFFSFFLPLFSFLVFWINRNNGRSCFIPCVKCFMNCFLFFFSLGSLNVSEKLRRSVFLSCFLGLAFKYLIFLYFLVLCFGFQAVIFSSFLFYEVNDLVVYKTSSDLRYFCFPVTMMRFRVQSLMPFYFFFFPGSNSRKMESSLHHIGFRVFRFDFFSLVFMQEKR